MKFQSSDMQVELLPGKAYSVRNALGEYSLGIALQRQQGVHAIGTDRRADFDTWPGTLAHTPPGVDVFSESETGGEYLIVRWASTAELDVHEFDKAANRRHQWTGHAAALRRARHLRRLLLASERDELAVEQAMLALVNVERKKTTTLDQQLRAKYGRVLDRIASEFDQALTIVQLAASVDRTPLAFLREFTRMTGMTPHAYIVETRVQAARASMRRDKAPLAIIAADCGFTHQSHMGVAFRKVLGQTPGRYRAML
ncbi:AraC family transcriptional regulator [Janthinobacterium sp. J1-1]|uniref:AraC family transcriptional regulator n=1 Tax=Janthinobacterium sp. J1-1 TaxID=3065910 RepID=UPI0028128912|nr:AraC family transcriptional regulator [Janthinobacterium sp. J1-1]